MLHIFQPPLVFSFLSLVYISMQILNERGEDKPDTSLLVFTFCYLEFNIHIFFSMLAPPSQQCPYSADHVARSQTNAEDSQRCHVTIRTTIGWLCTFCKWCLTPNNLVKENISFLLEFNATKWDSCTCFNI